MLRDDRRAPRRQDAGAPVVPGAAARGPRSRALAAVVIALGLLSPSAGRAQSSEAIAESMFREAQEKMAAHDFDAACDLFARSAKIDPALGTLLNLAACHEKQGKIATAWAEFSAAYAGATRAGDERRAVFARARLSMLEKKLHRVIIEVMTPAPDLRVQLDGVELPREAWGTPLPLDPGDHRIEAIAQDRAPFVRSIHLGPSEGTDRIEVALQPLEPAVTPMEAPVPRDPAPPPAPLGHDRRWIGGWVAAGLGAAAIGVSIGLGVRMASAVSLRDQLCPPGRACGDQEAFSADHAARVDRLGVIVAGGIGLAALGTGVGLLIASRKQPSRVVEVSPVVGVGRAGLGLRGTF